MLAQLAESQLWAYTWLTMKSVCVSTYFVSIGTHLSKVFKVKPVCKKLNLTLQNTAFHGIQTLEAYA